MGMTQPSPFGELPATLQRGSLGRWTMLEQLVQTLITSRRMSVLVLTVAVAIALLAPLGPLASNRFHRDEAIYSSWGLDVASGRVLG